MTADEEVSRLHAVIECVGSHWTVVDDGMSRNGTFVNGERITGRRRLRQGDSIRIGGTLLTGGSGFILGSVLGVLVLGIIQTIISFEGTLSSWWTKIVIGALLLVFIVLQRLLTTLRR